MSFDNQRLRTRAIALGAAANFSKTFSYFINFISLEVLLEIIFLFPDIFSSHSESGSVFDSMALGDCAFEWIKTNGTVWVNIQSEQRPWIDTIKFLGFVWLLNGVHWETCGKQIWFAT